MHCSNCGSYYCDCPVYLKSSHSLNIECGANKYENDLGCLDNDVFTKLNLFKPVSLPPVRETYDIKFDYRKEESDFINMKIEREQKARQEAMEWKHKEMDRWHENVRRDMAYRHLMASLPRIG